MDLEQKAIERIKMASEYSQRYYEKPLIITTSGGKDSDVCVELAKRSGVVFEVQHSHTTADAPQTVYHVREQFKKLEERGISCFIDYPMYHGQQVSMWSLIPEVGMPPTRFMRYCCSILKEQAGKKRVIVTGVRKDESIQRSDREAMEANGKTKKERIALQDTDEQNQISIGEIFLNNDNDPRRKMIECCERKSKIVCNPIIDWTTRDVWDFIHQNN